MSHTNKHRCNHANSVAEQYMKELRGPTKKCPRRQCKGTLVEVLSRYENKGPINKEQECSECGKVVKDERFKGDRERRWKRKQQQGNSSRTNSNNRTTSNNRTNYANR